MALKQDDFIPGITDGTMQDVGNVGYSTNQNYLEHQNMAGGLGSTLARRANVGNRNVRTATQKFGTAEFGEYQDKYSTRKNNPHSAGIGGGRINAGDGIYGDFFDRQRSVMGTVPGAFRGEQQIGDDRLAQHNNTIFNPNVRSDVGMNDMYENFYNQQGIV